MGNLAGQELKSMPIMTGLLLCSWLAFSNSPVAAAAAPYEDFPAADFTRGERETVGERSIGLYTHFRSFDRIYSGDRRVSNISDVSNRIWVPALIANARFSEAFAISIKAHGAVIRTSLLDAAGRRQVGSLNGMGDIFLYGIWSPWRSGAAQDHSHSFFDLHNFSLVAGPKFDLSYKDPGIGTVAGAEFRQTGAAAGESAHEAVFGAGYTGHLNERAWLYAYGQFLVPVNNTPWGMRPGKRSENQLGISWLPSRNVQLFIQTAYTHLTRSSGGRFPDISYNSGGNFVFLGTGTTMDVWNRFGFELAINFPIYQKVRGTQLVGNEDYFFGIYRAF